MLRIQQIVALICCAGALSASAGVSPSRDGQAIYDFYCYQCHAYSGDGRTLAASFLDPPPRDFTRADPAVLQRSDMIDAVANGRPGTAMAGFTGVISAPGIAAVVDFIRARMMSGVTDPRRYHTPENGWREHDRFADAYPFATGEIALDTPWETLTPSARHGLTLYLGACVSCHDNPRGASGGEELLWDLRPLSYPRRHYSHAGGHLISGASPYAIHDQRPVSADLSSRQRHGQVLYEANCAFCHAMDGTGRNWIGRFMEPHPRDLTQPRFAEADVSALKLRVLEGLPGTSMPAWRGVLSDDEISDILEYVTRVLARGNDRAESAATEHPAVRPRLIWQRTGD